jgi:hypothetical protein
VRAARYISREFAEWFLIVLIADFVVQWLLSKPIVISDNLFHAAVLAAIGSVLRWFAWGTTAQ